MLAGGTVLTGGYPTRVLRLTPAGGQHVEGWWSGAPVPDNPKARALARRLLDTGIAHPARKRRASDQDAGDQRASDQAPAIGTPARSRS